MCFRVPFLPFCLFPFERQDRRRWRYGDADADCSAAIRYATVVVCSSLLRSMGSLGSRYAAVARLQPVRAAAVQWASILLVFNVVFIDNYLVAYQSQRLLDGVIRCSCAWVSGSTDEGLRLVIRRAENRLISRWWWDYSVLGVRS